MPVSSASATIEASTELAVGWWRIEKCLSFHIVDECTHGDAIIAKKVIDLRENKPGYVAGSALKLRDDVGS